MSSEKNITRGGLSGKMEGFQPVPPDGVWEGVAAAMHGKKSRRILFVLLGTAAGLALAITVGISLLSDAGQPVIVLHDADMKDQAVVADASENDAEEAATDSGINAFGDAAAGDAAGSRDRTEARMESGKKKPAGRFEDRVVTAYQEVSGEILSAAEGQQGRGFETGDLAELAAKPSAETGSSKDTVPAGGSDAPAKKPYSDRTLVNEDSIVKLLQGDAVDIQDTETHHKGKWQLGALLSPQISYRDAASADAAQNVAVNHSESARLTYSGGIQVSYMPNGRLTIQSGISYNKMGVNIGDYSNFRGGWFQSELDMVNAPGRSENVVSISNSMGTVVATDKEVFVNTYTGAGTLTDYHLLVPEEMIVADASVESFSQTFEFLEIPLNVRYRIIDRAFDVQLVGGFSTNLLVSNAVSVIAGDAVIAIGEVQDVRTVNYAGNAGVGVAYDLFENFSLSIEPRFRYYLNSINTSNLPVTRPYSFGLYTGLNYRF